MHQAASPLSPDQIQLLAWAVSNCHILARRALRHSTSVDDREKWEHVLRICEKAGAKSQGVLRASLPTELTEGAALRGAPPADPAPENREGANVMEKPLSGLWRNDPATPEGKYLVKRRDGTVVEWPNFVIGAKDPAAPAALRAYAMKAAELGMNPTYVADVMALATGFEIYRQERGEGDPDRGRHRDDDPTIIIEMRNGGKRMSAADAGRPPTQECPHVWTSRFDSDLGGNRTEVVCSLCRMMGERNDETNEVYYPAT